MLGRIEFGALASVAVLVAVVGAIGWGRLVGPAGGAARAARPGERGARRGDGDRLPRARRHAAGADRRREPGSVGSGARDLRPALSCASAGRAGPHRAGRADRGARPRDVRRARRARRPGPRAAGRIRHRSGRHPRRGAAHRRRRGRARHGAPRRIADRRCAPRGVAAGGRALGDGGRRARRARRGRGSRPRATWPDRRSHGSPRPRLGRSSSSRCARPGCGCGRRTGRSSSRR